MNEKNQEFLTKLVDQMIESKINDEIRKNKENADKILSGTNADEGQVDKNLKVFNNLASKAAKGSLSPQDLINGIWNQLNGITGNWSEGKDAYTLKTALQEKYSAMNVKGQK